MSLSILILSVALASSPPENALPEDTFSKVLRLESEFRAGWESGDLAAMRDVDSRIRAWVVRDDDSASQGLAVMVSQTWVGLGYCEEAALVLDAATRPGRLNGTQWHLVVNCFGTPGAKAPS